MPGLYTLLYTLRYTLVGVLTASLPPCIPWYMPPYRMCTVLLTPLTVLRGTEGSREPSSSRFTVGQSLKPLRDPFHCWASLPGWGKEENVAHSSLPGCGREENEARSSLLGWEEKGRMWPVLASWDGERRGNVARSSLLGWENRGGMWPVLASWDGRIERECGPF